MNFDLIIVIIASYLVGVITTKMRAKCVPPAENVVDRCPYSEQHHGAKS